MHSNYYIILRMRAGLELECFGQFNFSAPHSFMEKIYTEMKGIRDGGEELPIQIDFMEVVGGIPSSFHIVACTLDELACNVKVIAREVFKIFNLL